MKPFFSNLKVIELAGVLAGPSVGVFFAELGAKVIKIENKKTNGDVTRTWKLSEEDQNASTSAYYWSINTGKEVLFLDLKSAEDVKKVYDLIKDADIVITNYKKGDDKKLKVDYHSLSAINPKLIYASITGFGTESYRLAYDLILQAESGFMDINGEKDSMPVKLPVAFIDLIAGHQLKEAILVALLNRERNNQGSYVTVSLFDSALASLVNQATNWLIAKHVPRAIGSLNPNISPYGEIFKTSDGHLITFAIGSDKQFAHLCEFVGSEELITNEKFSTNQHRVTNRSELFQLLTAKIEKLPFDNLFKQCLEKEIPIGKIRNIKEVFELPEAKEMLKHFSVDGETKTAVNSIAFKFIDNV
jgi:crotonobetainyl-CoA:carnitine CoA-transferase CaiB-like acyl-CoA transferase